MKAVKDIRLLVSWKEFAGWTQWETESCLLTPADAWSLEAPNIHGALANTFEPGQAAKLILDGTTVMSGRIDQVVKKDGTVQVTGRDAFAPLIDCSATPGTRQNVSLLTLANALSEPWGLTWTVQTGITLGLHASVKIEPGETPWDVLSVLAKKDRVLLWCEPDGTGKIGRPNYTADLAFKLCRYIPGYGREENNNIMAGGVTLDWQDRYSSITVTGTSGNTKNAWARNSHRRHTATDSTISVYRPLILMDGDLKTLGLAKQIAEEEIKRRAHDATVLEYEVSGHYGTPVDRESEELLYTPGQRGDVVDQETGVQDVYMLTTRRFSLTDEEGPKTSLTLHPEGWLA